MFGKSYESDSYFKIKATSVDGMTGSFYVNVAPIDFICDDYSIQKIFNENYGIFLSIRLNLSISVAVDSIDTLGNMHVTSIRCCVSTYIPDNIENLIDDIPVIQELLYNGVKLDLINDPEPFIISPNYNYCNKMVDINENMYIKYGDVFKLCGGARILNSILAYREYSLTMTISEEFIR